jgi:hypothetical protein
MMLSNDVAENPRLHDAHHVWLPYCTGDTWQFIVRPIKARRGHGMRRAAARRTTTLRRGRDDAVNS